MHPEIPSDQSPPTASAEPRSEAPDDPAPGDTTSGDTPKADDRPSPPPPPSSPPGGADPAAAGGGGWAPPFQILRSRHDRKLGGVAGGLAVAAGLDPTLVRFAIVLGFLTGWGVLAYLIAWAVIPEEDPAKGRYLMPAPEQTARYLRIGLTVLGVLGLLHVVGTVLGIVSSAILGIGLFPFHVLGFGDSHGFELGEALLGLLLIVGGLVLLFRRHLPWTPAPDTGVGPGAGSGSALATIRPGSGGPAAGYGPPAAPAGPAGASGFGARASAAARAAVTNGPLLLVRATGWLVALWFLAAMLVGVAFWVTGALRVHLPALPIVTGLAALGTLGYTLIRSRRVGAVIAAMALLLVPATVAVAVTRVDGQAGNRSVSPMTASDLERQYRHSLGSLDLDLSALQLPAGSRTPIDLSMGVGRIEVIVPWDADVEARAEVGLGSFDLFGNRQTGVNLNGRTHSTGQPGAAVVDIRGEAGAGEVVVRRGLEPITQQALRAGQPVPMRCGPSRRELFGFESAGTLHCTAADGVTRTPPLNCVVSAYGSALCRPVGEPEPTADFAADRGTVRCQVPAGGGEATCTPATLVEPAPSTTATSTTTVPVPSAPPGEYRCTIPEGGGPATCVPA